MGGPPVVAGLGPAGGPYPVAAPPVGLALTQISLGETAVRDHVARVREERRSLGERLAALGVEPLPSQANFVYVECGPPPRAPFVAAALRALGILVRDFPGRAGCETALRITLPGDEAKFERLVHALETALAPEALLLDLDGVLADVRDSQRAAIAATAAAFGVTVTSAEVAQTVREGDAANDWAVTRRLIEGRGARASLEDVTTRYQALYLGRPGARGLREHERLGARRAWLVGDTPDDARAAAAAAVLPLAVVAPGDDRAATSAALAQAGAARVLDDLTALLEVLP